MIFITSPAKTQDFESNIKDSLTSKIQFPHETLEVLKAMRTLTANELKDLLKVSDKILQLNLSRLEKFDMQFSNNSRPALKVYKGDIYKQFEEELFDRSTQEYLQKSLRIVTGFYGVLKPYDLIQAYRLEMKSRLSVNDSKDLYEFWKEKITNSLSSELETHEEKVLIDIASKEYSKVIDRKKFKHPITEIIFKQRKANELKNIGIYSKMARGHFINFIAKAKPTKLIHLRKFNLDGYKISNHNKDSLEFIKEI